MTLPDLKLYRFWFDMIVVGANRKFLYKLGHKPVRLTNLFMLYNLHNCMYVHIIQLNIKFLSICLLLALNLFLCKFTFNVSLVILILILYEAPFILFLLFYLAISTCLQITTFNISLVVHGTIAETMDFLKVFAFRIQYLNYVNNQTNHSVD